MKKKYLIIALLSLQSLHCQISVGFASSSETFSSNGTYKLKSFSYDNEMPNLKGESFVSYTDEDDGKTKNLYKINRSFDLWDGEPFFVAISNDGRKIIYIKDRVYYGGKEHENVTLYLDGKLTKAYTTEEFIDCDRQKEKCEMFSDKRNPRFKHKRATFSEYEDKLTNQDKFLIKNYVFNKNDTIYITDGRKKVTLFDLNSMNIIQSKIDFDSLYPKIKNIQVKQSRISSYRYPFKYIIDIENIQNNVKLSHTISELSNLKFISSNSQEYYKFKLHDIELTGYMNRNGKFEIDSISTDPIFDQQKIINYIDNTTFKTDFIPAGLDKIYVRDFFGGYRSFDERIAEKETIKAKERREEEYKKRLTLDKIDNFYIPKNLYECNTELDKILDFESKKMLVESVDPFEFNSHMGGLGMWIRNNWGLNGGSRLLKYFYDRNVGNEMFGRDTMSGIIIEQYIKWLKGDKTAWEKWEKQNPVKLN
ncbi:DUF6794 domain-containing protein [Flavobacterium lindanitolerans]|uniref:DUF6794 domain-containing protein n=1 Tax=Flavobacterium lindanitolerans TaxID=428988 RepID=UPI00280935BF|nr:DUF6794 domain-containing protein [Flavobacterium lindanitolerans]MDQ7961785.1 DUF6794 domain-containing protein [Flavobacterium lindanitolerans]